MAKRRDAVGIWLVLGTLAGCGGGAEAPTGPAFEGVTLQVAATADPAILDAVRVQGNEWARTNGAELSIGTEPVEPSRARESADVIVFRGDQLGALIDAGALADLPESAVRPSAGLVPLGGPSSTPKAEPDPSDPLAGSAPRRDPLDFADVIQNYRERVTRYGEVRYALPLGGAALVLAFRRDALENEALKAEAASAGISLAPPTTWAELDALSRFLHGKSWDADPEPEAGLAIALGDDPEGVADAAFLARAAALGRPPDRYEFLFDSDDLAPRVASPPFVQALTDHVALKDAAPEGAAGFNAQAAREAFRRGEAALLIDRAERAGTWTDPKSPAPVGVVPLPGASRFFDPGRGEWRESTSGPNRPAYLPAGGGWLVGVSSRTEGKARDAAIAYVVALGGPEVAQGIVSDPAFPMTPVRSSHLGLGLPDPRAALGIDSRAWGVAVEQTLGADRVVVGLRIPGAEGYLADLAAARASALAGTDPAEALEAAADAWAARSEGLGKDRQLWHYRRSLNTLSTGPEPPPRP